MASATDAPNAPKRGGGDPSADAKSNSANTTATNTSRPYVSKDSSSPKTGDPYWCPRCTERHIVVSMVTWCRKVMNSE